MTKETKFESKKYGVRAVVVPAGTKHVDNVIRDYDLFVVEIDSDDSVYRTVYSDHGSLAGAIRYAKSAVREKSRG